MKSPPETEKKWKTTKSASGRKLNLRGDKELVAKLQNTRVVQHDLVYIIGLSPRIATRAVFWF